LARVDARAGAALGRPQEIDRGRIAGYGSRGGIQTARPFKGLERNLDPAPATERYLRMIRLASNIYWTLGAGPITRIDVPICMKGMWQEPRAQPFAYKPMYSREDRSCPADHTASSSRSA